MGEKASIGTEGLRKPRLSEKEDRARRRTKSSLASLASLDFDGETSSSFSYNTNRFFFF